MAKNYISNKKFYEEIVKHRELAAQCELCGLPRPPLPNYIGECLLLIANKLSNKPNFIAYPHKEEMISDGIENCVKYFHVFDPARSNNPFAFFTQTIKNAFIRRIKLEKKQLYIKHKATQNFVLTSQLNDNTITFNGLNESANHFVKDYEDSNFLKKNKPIGLERAMEQDGEQTNTACHQVNDRVPIKPI